MSKHETIRFIDVPTVTFYVGEAKARVQVHMDQPCDNSPVFKAAFTSEFKEDLEKTMQARISVSRKRSEPDSQPRAAARRGCRCRRPLCPMALHQAFRISRTFNVQEIRLGGRLRSHTTYSASDIRRQIRHNEFKTSDNRKAVSTWATQGFYAAVAQYCTICLRS